MPGFLVLLYCAVPCLWFDYDVTLEIFQPAFWLFFPRSRFPICHDWISVSVIEVTVGPGDNITFKCECKTSPGVYIVWCRNCPHENQATLVLKRNLNAWRQTSNAAGWILNTFCFVWNCSSESYDLLIMNTTDNDEGLYYCGTYSVRIMVQFSLCINYITFSYICGHLLHPYVVLKIFLCPSQNFGIRLQEVFTFTNNI